ncbi:GNAT family N-acetyltransferase [Piscibacillus sp. B03]|uniref:GNAT family N-acetyltransferase n=1 Tax=Piscibacillus sp. B03 TaxID=3457430 RepID=UPI003FCCD3A0
MLNIVRNKEISQQLITNFFKEHWGSPKMVISSGVYQCDEMDGFTVLEDHTILGLITYTITDQECEIISIDSLIEGRGVGSALIAQVEAEAKEAGCQTVKLITTNDNLHAARFYQKRGYRLSLVYPDAVEKARQLKPGIPLLADNGIPIRDEWLFIKGI